MFARAFVLFLTVAAIACSAGPASEVAVEASAKSAAVQVSPTIDEKTWNTVNWHVEEVRVSALGDLVPSGDRAANSAAGAGVGGLAAYALGATPAGLAVGVLAGAAAGSTIPVTYSDRQNTTCMLFVSVTDGNRRVRKTFTYTSKDHPAEVGKCLNARANDTLVIETMTHRVKADYTEWKIKETRNIVRMDLLRP